MPEPKRHGVAEPSMPELLPMSFADHFSAQAAPYRRYRPHYPAALFAYLADSVTRRQRAWDCGTGSGQAAQALARYFATVFASDASAAQIAHAIRHERVHYRVAPAEDSGLTAASVDLITVAQALHWFDLARFYAEVERVLRPAGVLAVWCYGLLRVTPTIDSILTVFYRETVGPFWPPQRRWVDNGYRDLPLPFAERSTPAFAITAQWNLPDLLGYLGTWSAVQRYRDCHRTDPVAALCKALAPAWGEPANRYPVQWPIQLRLGRKTGQDLP